MENATHWTDYLDEHNAFMEKTYHFSFLAAKESEIAELKEKMNQENYVIGEEYYDFLSKTNGIDYNGMMIFAEKEYLFFEDDIIYGIVEYNNDIADNEVEDTNVYFGVMGDDLFAYTRENKWATMDIISGDIMDIYDSLDEFLFDIMKMLYGE